MLPQDVSISIEEQNPLFSDSGSFSYPIELSISQNRELFKSIDSPQGRTRPQHLDGLPFELWFDGVMLLYGSTETDEDLDIDEDKCSINLVSGNGDFQSKIEGMQCTDVPLLGDIFLGYSYPGGRVSGNYEGIADWSTEMDFSFDEGNAMDFQRVNVSSAYSPSHPYCNVRVCVKRSEEYDKEKESPYHELEADRPWSGICFYVAYFLDCLFKHIGATVKENNLGKVDDMNRLSFITTKCEHKYGNTYKINNRICKAGKYVNLELDPDEFDITSVYIEKKEVYATEKNFPATDVSSVIESLFNAFGLKIYEEPRTGYVHLVYIRDVLRDNEVIDASMNIVSRSVSYSKVKGVRMTYGEDEDTAFKYNDWERIVLMNGYNSYRYLINKISPYDKNLYIDPITGNKYRVKIDGDAEKEGDEQNLNPSLFKVAQFNDYVVGEDVEETEDLELGFTPMIENDTSFIAQKLGDNINQQTLSLYVDGAEMGKENELLKIRIFKLGKAKLKTRQYRYMNYDASQANENPLLTHDTGFMLGIMRGPGNNSDYTITVKDYDGNGNDAWVTVAADYATTSDTMDAYGNHYDYNGVASGGVPSEAELLNERISLYTHVQTSKDVGLADKDGEDAWGINSTAAKRGLADRFMSEYMHFLLHRKTVSMEVDTTLSQLTSLSWFKQLRISDTVGRLKSRSYTLTNSGVSDMSIELYTIN